jgi:hypothetical protein
MSTALAHGGSLMESDDAWLGDLHARRETALLDVSEAIDALRWNAPAGRWSMWRALAEVAEARDALAGATAWQRAAGAHLSYAIAVSESSDGFLRALPVLIAMREPVERCKSVVKRFHAAEGEMPGHPWTAHAGMATIAEQIAELEDSMITEQFRAEAKREFVSAEATKGTALNDDDELNVDAMWQAVDAFRTAIVLARGRDIELEARCLTEVAIIHEKVFSNLSLAHRCFKAAVELIITYRPVEITDDGFMERFRRQDWVATALAALKRFQDRAVANDTAAYDLQRQPIIAKLKEQGVIEGINKASAKGAVDLIVHIYEHHPPKRGEQIKPSKKDIGTAPDKIKTMLKKAIVQYARDKNLDWGLEWTVLCEEIQKTLNNKYEAFK